MSSQVAAAERLSSRGNRVAIALFSLTLAWSASLMFLLEPMAAKMVLPSLGGAPAVWNTCVTFFQAMLLGGYAYAHAAPKQFGIRRHAAIHVGVLLVSALTLLTPFRLDQTTVDSAPIVWLLLTLLKSIGLPFFLLATTAPLLQKWFSAVRHRGARDPYFLYAASNLGSFAGLITYLIGFEPFLTLREQARYWTFGYMAFSVAVAACLLSMARAERHTATVPADESRVANLESARLTLWRRLRWVLLAFAPSSLMLAVTTFISTDVAAVPLLWVLPLAGYLLTFVVAFSSTWTCPRSFADRGLGLLMLLLVQFLVLGVNGPLKVVVPVHLSVFLLSALVCHRQLAEDRPDPAHLTEFYLLIALGGVLGSLFNTLAAPMLFTGIVEYPAVLVLVCCLRALPTNGSIPPRLWRTAGPVIIAAAAAGVLLASSKIESVPVLFALLAFPSFMCLSLTRTRLPFVAAVAGLLAAGVFRPDPLGRPLHAERTFFGTYKVRQDPMGEYRVLTHGTTLHGMQRLSDTRGSEPLSYYHRTGPLGDVFDLPIASHPAIGVVGLGAGSIAAYRRGGQAVTFFEIDPAVEVIARTSNYFTYLSMCGNACRVIIGDARQSLAGSGEQFGLLVLDAFSSDAIPVHLLTREALETYLARVAPNGVVAFHISNRHLDLEPVLSKIAQEFTLTALVRRDQVVAGDVTGKSSSVWVAMARDASVLIPLQGRSRWESLRSSDTVPLWTDDFSNILALLRR